MLTSDLYTLMHSRHACMCVCTNCIQLHTPPKTLILYSGAMAPHVIPTLWAFSLLFAFSEEDRISNSREHTTHNLKR